MRIIDADALNQKIKKEIPPMSNWGEIFIPGAISSAPTIDPESLPVVQQLRAELEKVKAERDAAVEMLHSLANEVGNCTGCKRLYKECSEVYICECDGQDHWEWCGVKED